MINNSSSPPPSPAQPPTPIDPWGDTFLSRLLVYSSCAAVCLYHTARFLLQCLERRRAAREAQEPKPPSQAVDGAGAVWAEADCAICLSELDPEGGERVRVLPACGHAYHDAMRASLARHARVLPHLPRALPVPAVTDDQSAVAKPDQQAAYSCGAA